ncbi:MAG: PilZ domain-containing protein [Deltaproteobacteria bacterium]|nr:PilZ domain-containing protein [Deltaproteobacteria bacterium]
METIEQLLLDDKQAIDVKVELPGGAYEQIGTLRDIHADGMSFSVTEHVLQEDDIIHLETCLGDFSIESDAIVRWVLGSYIGVEFLDSRSRNAALLAELYTEKLLNFLGEFGD